MAVRKAERAADKHMSVAEVKRRFSDVMAEVIHTRRRIIVERRGRPMVAIVPLEEEADTRTPGQRLAAVIGFGGEEGDRFVEQMRELLPQLRSDCPREVRRVRPRLRAGGSARSASRDASRERCDG